MIRGIQIADSVPVAASVQDLWALIIDVENWPNFVPTVTAVRPLDGASPEVGRRFEVTQPGQRPAVWTVTEAEPGRVFAWRRSSRGLVLLGEHIIGTGADVREDGVGPASTCQELVSIARLTIGGPLGVALSPLLRPLAKSALAKENAAFRAEAESNASNGGEGRPA